MMLEITPSKAMHFYGTRHRVCNHFTTTLKQHCPLSYPTMRCNWIATCLALTLLAAPAFATDQEQKQKVAEDKAEVLEQKAAQNSSPAPAPKSEAITQPEVQAVDPAGKAPLDDAITCLARSIYWEAKGKDSADMEAVANVVMNRLGHEGFPDTVCGVVKQGSETKSCQFSWWCDGRPDSVQEEVQYSMAKEIARKALNKQLPDRTKGALYFHDRTVKPDWAKEYTNTANIGLFKFYKPIGGDAK
ncbi:Spore cortex-lytic enzyme precursor [compost metagenome]